MPVSRPRVVLVAAVLVAAVLTGMPQQASAATELTLYSAPTGSGTVCSSASPCSITTAQSQVRTHTTGMTGDIVVSLADGTYRLGSTLAFSSASGDSATNGYSVIYQAAAGAHPIFSGGQQITGWTQGSGGIWQASVPSGFDTRQLYVNGVRASRASGADPATFTRTSTGYTMSNSTLSSWGNTSNIEFVYGVGWSQMRCGVASASGTTVTMKQPCFANATLKQYGANADLPNYVENAKELLTQPDQWYLDKSTNTIYYMPRTGENLTTADVAVPNLQTIVSGTGTETAPLTNLVMRGIGFEYGTWLAPNGNDGFSEVQANMRLTGTNAYSNEGSCTRFSTTSPGTCPYGAWDVTPGNVVFSFTSGLTLDRNLFTHLGGAGLQLGQDASSSTISGNTFTDISGNGLEIGNGTDANPTDLTLLPTNNEIKDNWVHSIGVEYTGAVGIFQGYTRTSTIEHNQINDVPYSGISSNWGWGRTSTATTGNSIKNNLVFDYMQVRADGGGIYVLGQEGTSLATGLTISGNVIRGAGGGGHAIYTDGGSQFVTMTGNALYGNNTPDWGGCNEQSGTPYGDFSFTGNYWDNTTPDWPCGAPSNVTNSGNTAVGSNGSGVPAAILSAAGLESSYASIATPTAPTTTNLASGRPTQALYIDGTTASMQPGSVSGYAVDGDASTFAQATGQFRWQEQVDLQSVQPVGYITVTMPSSAYATAFHVDASADGSTYSTVATLTNTSSGTTTVPLATAVNARYIRIVADAPNNGGQTGGQMAISELGVYAAPNLASARPTQALYIDGTTAAMQSGDQPGYAVDGNTSTAAQASGQFRWQLQVDLQGAQSVNSLYINQPSANYATAFHVDASTNGTSYTTIATKTATVAGVTQVLLSTPVSARYLRVVADQPSDSGQVGSQMAISELGVYGSTNEALNRWASAQFIDGSTAQMQSGSVAGNAIDGSTSTFAQASGQYRWQLLVDLQKVQSIGYLTLNQPSTTYATAFHIDASVDGSNYFTVARMAGTSGGITQIPLSTPINARYLRVVADQPSAGGQTGSQMAITELSAFGPQ
jgi:F5/8 type C domain/Right handed beta helix region